MLYQLAVMVAVIRTSGITPKWKDTPIPVGRTIKAVSQVYDKMLKSVDGVPMAQPHEVPPSPARANGTNGNGTAAKRARAPPPTTKGKGKGNKRKAEDLSVSDNESDEKALTKVKRARSSSNVVTDGEITNEEDDNAAHVKTENAGDEGEGFGDEAF